VLSRAGTGTYSLTALGEHLRDDDPEGGRSWIDLEGAVGRADLCFVQLLHTVGTGEPAFPRQFGRSFWDDLSADSGRAASFDGLMGARLVADAPAIAAAYPWGTLGHVVDVGGGNGTLLIAILRAHDDLRGTVIDLAGPVPAPSKPSPPPAWATGPAPRPAASSTPFPRERAATSSWASCMTGMMRMHVAS
jgi:hypothetical protein